jgi:Flp pilus assembly protein TadG
MSTFEPRPDTCGSRMLPPSIRVPVEHATQNSKLKQFAEDAGGQVMMMFALMATALFMTIGLAVDYGRWLDARNATLSAIDAAVLAAGRALQTGNSQEAAIAIAEKYYAAAVKNRVKLEANSDTVKFIVVDNGTAVQSQGNGFVETPFMGLGGVPKLALLRDTQADQSKAVLAVGGNSELNLEIAMMLDVSGSMCNSAPQGNTAPCGTGNRKLDDMKAAAKDLVNIVVWQDQSKYTSKVALVPFSGDVRVPTALQAALTSPATTLNHQYKDDDGDWTTYKFKSSLCAAERAGDNKYTDAFANSTNGLVSRTYSYEYLNSDSPDYCLIPENATILPLTNVKTTLETAIDALKAKGGTAGHVGTAWAYYMLSPNWSSLLTGTATPAAYNDAKHKKIAVLMTDGEYNYTFEALKDKNKRKSGVDPVTYNPIAAIPTSSSFGSGSTSKSINEASSAAQAIAICGNMKTSGIEVYTVGFELPNQTAKDTLKACATSDTHAYDAKNGEELKQAFRDIALKISSLYLSK